MHCVIKKVRTRHCLPRCSIPFSFNDSSSHKSGNRGDQVLEFWKGNVIPFLSDISFSAVLGILHHVLNFMMLQMFSVGEWSGHQVGQFRAQALVL